MDIVTDLTSQAVSYIIVMQDMCKRHFDIDAENCTSTYFLKTAQKITKKKTEWHQDGEKCSHELRQVSDVIWMSKNEVFQVESLDCFVESSQKLLEWYHKFDERVNEYFKERTHEPLGGLGCSPYQWRESIRYILYKYPAEREQVVKIIHYIPVQIVLALGGGIFNEYKQGLLQVYEPGYKLNVVSERDRTTSADWWQHNHNGKTREDELPDLLRNDAHLLEKLKEAKVPVPFETLLNDELNQIEKRRELQLTGKTKEHKSKLSKTFSEKEKASPKHCNTNDPLSRAKSMHLYGLAFSGGGIRSATFNLGVLQRLAQENLLKKFDFLSTVSGGGYIGSWFESWVLRTRSIDKVNDRLNPDKSADPQGEEVRPIRWLRMFSNYLAPNKSVLSADSWTIGITWFRNTIINQVILLLLLCCALWGIKLTYELWRYLVSLQVNLKILPGDVALAHSQVFWSSAVVFIPAALFAGWGMHAYNPQYRPRSPFNREKNTLLANLLMAWGFISAFCVSSWMFMNNLKTQDIMTKVGLLWPAAIMGFIGLLLVAYMGRYDKCQNENLATSDNMPENKRRLKIIILIVLSSAIASVIGLFLLACSWQLANIIRGIKWQHHTELGFIVGLPLVLEAISVIVVVRMAILGNIFPDERREWWGRVGAIVHRFIFLWILAIGAVMYLPHFDQYLTDIGFVSKSITAFGGWAAVIGYAVKLAFSPKTSGDKPVKGTLSVSEVFISAAPYLFGAGILILGAFITNHITAALIYKQQIKIGHGYLCTSPCCKAALMYQQLLINAALCVGAGIIAVLISMRVGVNEFSLHHFYCNRLVRAYLGATKGRKEREQSVNNFTGFNKGDDLNLTDLASDKYTGPYPIINTTLNATVVTDLDRQDRRGESFIFTPGYCGFDFSRTRPSSRSAKKSYDYAYRPTADYSAPGGPTLGTAMAVSGAAVDPNMGYHSSPATAFLLTIFNLRLGRWVGNPRKAHWQQSDPQFGLLYLVKDLIGESDSSSDFVCLSDGGHFDNMGIYELVRRRCRYILLCDAEEDEDAICEGLANAIRRCRIDFGVQITINIELITKKDPVTKYSAEHMVTGHIWYPDDPAGKPSGTLVYVKTSITGNESVDVREYLKTNDGFPQQSTADQFFDESQFESYRELGYSSFD